MKKVKKIVFAIVAVSLLFTQMSFSFIVKADASYVLACTANADGTTATVTGFSTAPTLAFVLVIPSSVVIGSTTYTVTDIAANAFKANTLITSVTFPSTLKTIGASAFDSCTGWNTACDLPNGLTSIGVGAFKSSANITSVLLPGTLTNKIGNQAFYSCNNMASLTIGEGITYIPDTAFYDVRLVQALTLPSTCTTICLNAFNRMKGLKSLTFSNINTITLTTAGCDINVWRYPLVSTAGGCIGGTNWATGYTKFYAPNFKVLSQIYTTYTNLMTDAPSKAYFAENNFYISGVITNNGCTYGIQAGSTIPYKATLKGVATPSTTNFELDFSSSPSFVVTESSVPYTCTVISIDTSAFSGNTYLTRAVLPSTLTNIGSNAFYGCTKLTSANIPGNVGSNLGASVFQNCSALRSIDIGDGVKNLPNRLFSACENLDYIIVPQSVLTADYEAFHNCARLRVIIFSGSAFTVSNNGGKLSLYNLGTRLRGDVTVYGLNDAMITAINTALPVSRTLDNAQTSAPIISAGTVLVEKLTGPINSYFQRGDSTYKTAFVYSPSAALTGAYVAVRYTDTLMTDIAVVNVSVPAGKAITYDITSAFSAKGGSTESVSTFLLENLDNIRPLSKKYSTIPW